MLQKFIEDFVMPTPIFATEVVFWHGRKAWTPLPWMPIDGDDVLNYPEGEFDNQKADRCHCRFLDSRPDFSEVVFKIRGTNGLSIDTGSRWTQKAEVIRNPIKSSLRCTCVKTRKLN